MIKKVTATLLGMMGLIMVGILAKPAAANAVTVPDGALNVRDYGARPNDNGDDAAAIQQALDSVEGSSTQVTVYIPSGTYYLDRGLRVWSNTTILAEKDTTLICRATNGYMLYSAHRHSDGSLCIGIGDDCRGCKIGGYNQAKNITINGGIWDRNTSNKEVTIVVGIKHAQNIKLYNATFMHSTDHLVNLSGTKDVIIKNCKFKDNVDYAGSDKSYWTSGTSAVDKRFRLGQREAIHLDFTNKVGEGNTYPSDNTPCVNIEVTNCTFSNVGSGVGTHHECDKKRGSNISVTGCTFSKVTGYLVDFFSSDNCVFADCTISGSKNGALVRVSDANATINNLSMTSIDTNMGPSIYVRKKSTVNISNVKLLIEKDLGNTENSLIYINDSTATIKKCQLKNGDSFGIYAATNANLNVTGTTVDTTKDFSIGVNDCGKVTVQKNTIKNAKAKSKGAIYIGKTSKAIVADNNIQKSAGLGIYVVDSSAVQVLRNKITTAGSIAIYATSAPKVKIIGNTISNISNASIGVVSSSSSTIESNVITKAKKLGIYVYQCKKTLINKNTVTNPKDTAIHVEKGSSNTISNNTVTAPNGQGITILSKSCTVSGNTIKNPTRCGIYTRSTEGLTVLKNKISGCGSCGVYVEDAKKVVIKNNTIGKNKSIGIYVFGTSAKSYASATITGNTVKASKSKFAIYMDKYCKSSKVKSNKVGGRGYYSESKYKVADSKNKAI